MAGQLNTQTGQVPGVQERLAVMTQHNLRLFAPLLGEES